jgi:hypothetical protein
MSRKNGLSWLTTRLDICMIEGLLRIPSSCSSKGNRFTVVLFIKEGVLGSRWSQSSGTGMAWGACDKPS